MEGLLTITLTTKQQPSVPCTLQSHQWCGCQSS